MAHGKPDGKAYREFGVVGERLIELRFSLRSGGRFRAAKTSHHTDDQFGARSGTVDSARRDVAGTAATSRNNLADGDALGKGQ